MVPLCWVSVLSWGTSPRTASRPRASSSTGGRSSRCPAGIQRERQRRNPWATARSPWATTRRPVGADRNASRPGWRPGCLACYLTSRPRGSSHRGIRRGPPGWRERGGSSCPRAIVATSGSSVPLVVERPPVHTPARPAPQGRGSEDRIPIPAPRHDAPCQRWPSVRFGSLGCMNRTQGWIRRCPCRCSTLLQKTGLLSLAWPRV